MSLPRRTVPHWSVPISLLWTMLLSGRAVEHLAASARYSWWAFLRCRAGVWRRRMPRPWALCFLPRRAGSCSAAWTPMYQNVPAALSGCLLYQGSGQRCRLAAHGRGIFGCQAVQNFSGSAGPAARAGCSDWFGWNCWPQMPAESWSGTYFPAGCWPAARPHVWCCSAGWRSVVRWSAV